MSMNYNDIRYVQSIASLANKRTANINPNFALGEVDYENYINGTTRKIDDTIGFNSPNSLYVKGGGNELVGSNLIQFTPFKKYQATVIVRGLYNGQADPNKYVTYYFGVACYDDEMLPIYLRYQNPDNTKTKLGELVEPLNKGDTQLKFKPLNGASPTDIFPNNSNKYYRYVIGFEKQDDGTYRYISDKGHIYEPLGYSRVTLNYDAYPSNGITDNGDGTYTLKLNRAWESRNLKVGDVVRQSEEGGTYNYWIPHRKEKLDGKWHKYQSTKFNFNLNETNRTFIRMGARYMRLLLLPNYGADDNVETWYGYLGLEEA